VKQYVDELYTPAAVAERAVTTSSFQPARELAAWTAKVEKAWTGVHVAHVESGGVDATPQLGEHLNVRAYVELGDLVPDDVKVELVYGHAREGDQLTDIRRLRLDLESHDLGSPATFHGTVELDLAGAFGYTVRVVPNHALLATPAELGLLATAG
jgi:starch phosphorylase